MNQDLARGVFLALIALFFSVYAFQYTIGTLASAGPGLFPLLVASLLFVLALIMIVRSRTDSAPGPRVATGVRAVSLILAALGAFVLSAQYVSTLLGIVLLVMIAGFAARPVSWRRNALVSLGLIAIAYGFERFLGLNLRLFEWKF